MVGFLSHSLGRITVEIQSGWVLVSLTGEINSGNSKWLGSWTRLKVVGFLDWIEKWFIF